MVEDASPAVTAAQVDAAMLAAQALIGVAAQSVSEVEDRVTMPQLRVLVLVATRGPFNLNALADALGVHPSNATRACDRLVALGLLLRTESTVDRRNLFLGLTPDGQLLIDTLLEHRRAAMGAVLARLPDHFREALVGALLAFGAAADEAPGSQAWKLGWHA